MIYVLTPEQMRAADAAAFAGAGEDELMRNAGLRVADRLRTMAPQRSTIVAFAGPGNNGGDAFSALAELAFDYECVVAGDMVEKHSGARAAAELRAKRAGVRVVSLPADEASARRLVRGALAVDGLFGTGARLPLPEAYRHIVRVLDARERAVLAIDVPSGIDALTGAVEGEAVRASTTVTLAAVKPGLLLEPARDYVGELWCARIGIDDATLAAQPNTFAALDDDAFLRLLPRRASDSDKRAAGAPLIVAGSAQFPGAAVLCALGAARAGAGYVTVATPRSVAKTLRTHLIEQVVVELSDDAPAEDVAADLLEISKHNGAVAIGPGMGLDERTGRIFELLRRREPAPDRD